MAYTQHNSPFAKKSKEPRKTTKGKGRNFENYQFQF